MNSILIVDDDLITQKSLSETLSHHKLDVEHTGDGQYAIERVKQKHFDLVLLDVNMPWPNGLYVLKEIKKYDPLIIVIMITAYSNVQDAVNALKDGAYDYIERPISSEDLVRIIQRALMARTFVETSVFSAPKLSLGEISDTEQQFIGESDLMKKVFLLIEKLAKVNTPVLLRGESGTGKELVAKAIHYNGPRKNERFVAINCAAIPENLIESELFGYEKGSFTGAQERKIGKFLYANGGTLFLDEIGDVSPAIQVKLLRFLQEKSFTPIGSNREVSVDVRIIAASHRPFEELIKQGLFREDLFYRLNVLPVFLPPLRNRKSDIPHLVKYYIKYFNRIHSTSIKGISVEALELLIHYKWPGNIRELRNVLEHAFIMESSEMITPLSLPNTFLCDPLRENLNEDNFRDENEKSSIAALDFDKIQDEILNSKNQNRNINLNKYDFQQAKEEFEKSFIIEVLKRNSGKINVTALNANIPKKTLLRKIEKYNLKPKEFSK